MTRKAGIINKLTTLTTAEKEKAVNFFTDHPNYESDIDWNRKGLAFNDFKRVFAKADESKKNKKRKAKTDPALLFENQNCRIIAQTRDYIIVMPLDWKCAQFFNSFECGGEGARWCIGDRKINSHWNHYANNNKFYFIYFIKRHFCLGNKMIIQYTSDSISSNQYILTAWAPNNTGLDISSLSYIFVNPGKTCIMFRNILQTIINDDYKRYSTEYLFNLIQHYKDKCGFSQIFYREVMEIAVIIYERGEKERERIIKLIDSLNNEIMNSRAEN